MSLRIPCTPSSSGWKHGKVGDVRSSNIFTVAARSSRGCVQVLGQRHVDRVRTVTRFRPLEEAGDLPGAGDVTEDADRTRYVGLLQQALTDALGALAARDRLRLSSYYLQQLRMAEIGRLLGESEATVSRKLERTRTHLRRDVEHRLRHDQRLTDPQVRLCFEYAVEHWPFDMTAALAGQDS